jgi:hypothetical protein
MQNGYNNIVLGWDRSRIVREGVLAILFLLLLL